MESPLQSSFIPHENPQSSISSGRRMGDGGLQELFLLMSIVSLIASGALAGGVFLYERSLQNTSTAKIHQLERAKAAFDPSLIQQLTRLDNRMHAADTLLSSHIAPTVFFQALQQATLSTIAFRTLQMAVSDPQKITIAVTGIAQSVNSVALQAEVFSKNGVITSPIFSGINRQLDGVHFNLDARVNPAAINYVQSLQVGQPVSADTSLPQQSQETKSPFNTSPTPKGH